MGQAPFPPLPSLPPGPAALPGVERYGWTPSWQTVARCPQSVGFLKRVALQEKLLACRHHPFPFAISHPPLRSYSSWVGFNAHAPEEHATFGLISILEFFFGTVQLFLECFKKYLPMIFFFDVLKKEEKN